MGISKEQFTDLMIRHEYGKKRTKINRLIRESNEKDYDFINFRREGREKNIIKGNKKIIPKNV